MSMFRLKKTEEKPICIALSICDFCNVGTTDQDLPFTSKKYF